MAHDENLGLTTAQYAPYSDAEEQRHLGSGAYGTVILVKCVHSEVEYASKVWHDKLLTNCNFTPSDIRALEESLSHIQHVNVTQFIGFHKVEGNKFPAVVMEKLDMNLHQLLSNASSLPFPIKLSISMDICSGLAFLHSRQPAVIHTDLTPTNVLLTTALTGKVSDVWNHMVVDVEPTDLVHQLQMQESPVLCYLPVQDLMSTKEYSASFDVFSLGKIMFDIMAHPYCDSAKSHEAKDTSKKVIQICLGQHYNEINEIIEQCVHADANLRPACKIILRSLKKMYKNLNLEQGWKKKYLPYLWESDPAQELNVHQLKSALAATREEKEKLLQLIMPSEGNSECPMEDACFPLAKEEVGKRPEDSAITTRDIHNNLSLLPLHWTKEEKGMPFPMSRYIQVVEINGILYIGGGESDVTNDECKVIAFNLSSKTWETLPCYHAMFFAMTSVNQRLTLVGGYNTKREVINSIGSWDGSTWKSFLEPMPTCRSHCSAINYKKWLIVAGGTTSRVHPALGITEILDLDTNQWHRGPDTPQYWYSMRSVLISNTWYLMGGHNTINNVFSANLDELVLQEHSQNVWETLPTLGSIYSTPVVQDEDLLAVGGRCNAYKSEEGIYRYDQEKKEWILVGRLPYAVCNCACIVVAGNMYMFGGHDGKIAHNTTYIAANICK